MPNNPGTINGLAATRCATHRRSGKPGMHDRPRGALQDSWPAVAVSAAPSLDPRGPRAPERHVTWARHRLIVATISGSGQSTRPELRKCPFQRPCWARNGVAACAGRGSTTSVKRWLAVCRIVDVEQWRTPTADPDKSHHGSRSVVRNPVPPWSIEGVDAPKTVGY